MSVICLARGVCTLGTAKCAADGTITERTAAKFETDPAGGCVAVWKMDDETMKPEGDAEIFGDFDPAGFLKRAAQLLGPGRPGNIPDFEGIVKGMCRARFDDDCPYIDYCNRTDCRNCIVDEWMQEAKEGD